MKTRKIKSALGKDNSAVRAEVAIDASELLDDAAEALAMDEAIKKATRPGQTFSVGISIEKAHQMFREHGGALSKEQAQQAGTNTALDEFLNIMTFIANSHLARSFTINDVINHAKYLDLSADMVKRLFEQYSKYMSKSLMRLKETKGCYDDSIYSFEF
jgi:hypothetical protein